jgi:hypothetical protein
MNGEELLKSHLRIFGRKNLAEHMRLTRAWLDGGRDGVKRELLKMYPHLGEETSEPGSQEPPPKK